MDRRLIEDSALRKFSTPNAVNRLRAECVRDGDVMKLRFLVNGKRVTETQHESSGRLVGVELFAYSEKGGTDIRFENVLVRPVPLRCAHSGSSPMPTASAIRLM